MNKTDCNHEEDAMFSARMLPVHTTTDIPSVHVPFSLAPSS